MPAIFLKSFTACDAFAALPPTPSTNSRPCWSLTSARIAAIRSVAAVSRVLTICCTSTKKSCEKLMMVLLSRKGSAPDPVFPPGNRSRKTALLLHLPPNRLSRASAGKRSQDRKAHLPADLQRRIYRTLRGRNRYIASLGFCSSCHIAESGHSRIPRCSNRTCLHCDKPSSGRSYPTVRIRQRFVDSRKANRNPHTKRRRIDRGAGRLARSRRPYLTI